MSSASSALIQTLANNGVEVIFSLSGNQIMPLYDACIDANIRIIHTRHEGAAVYMAEAYAQLSGKLGVALVTAGPGLLNAVSALYSAARSETPILLISGDAVLAWTDAAAFRNLINARSPRQSPNIRHGQKMLRQYYPISIIALQPRLAARPAQHIWHLPLIYYRKQPALTLPRT